MKMKVIKTSAIMICLQKVLWLSLAVLLLTGCASRKVKRSLAGASTSSAELQQLAQQFAQGLAEHFAANLNAGDEILVALYPARNHTIDELPLDLLERSLVRELLTHKLYTVRVEDRQRALDELEFQLSGLGEGTLSAGKLKIPNYFLQLTIDENRYLLDAKTRRIERSFSLELRSVQTQLVEFSKLLQLQNNVPVLNRHYSF